MDVCQPKRQENIARVVYGGKGVAEPNEQYKQPHRRHPPRGGLTTGARRIEYAAEALQCLLGVSSSVGRLRASS
eukprot:scaffold174109_cov30-Tisochrysis_lutea.AAC.3